MITKNACIERVNAVSEGVVCEVERLCQNSGLLNIFQMSVIMKYFFEEVGTYPVEVVTLCLFKAITETKAKHSYEALYMLVMLYMRVLYRSIETPCEYSLSYLREMYSIEYLRMIIILKEEMVPDRKNRDTAMRLKCTLAELGGSLTLSPFYQKK